MKNYSKFSKKWKFTQKLISDTLKDEIIKSVEISF